MKKIEHMTWMIVRGLLVIFLFFNSVYFQYIPLYLFHVNVNHIAGNMRVAALLSVFSDLILMIIILFLYRRDLIEEAKKYISHWKENLYTGLTCWGVGLVVMILSNAILVFFFHSEGANNETLVREMIHAFPIIMGINVCFLAPFIEEIVFRKTFKDVFKSPYLFIPISFLAFGMAHVSSLATNIIDWFYIIPYGALGGAFAYAYYKTDTVFTSLTLHMMHNIFAFILILFI